MREKLFPPYLNRGSKGPAVALLQCILKSLGYGIEADAELVIDGDYGKYTALAVQEFQIEYGLDPDGNFGPMTRRAFFKETEFDLDSLPADLFVGETVPA